MRRCAFLTMEETDGWVIDDDLCHEPLKKIGWQVDEVPWTKPARWSDYEVVVVRSPWDYMHHLDRFLSVLTEIDASQAELHNSLELIRWNVHKSYLRDLDDKGVPVVPTHWLPRIEAGQGAQLFDTVGCDEIVVKPTVGGGAFNTHRLKRGADLSAAEAGFVDQEAMVQPLISAIIDEGEYSLFYFNGEYSHTVLKTPKAADFRVQEEHGGIITGVTPDAELRAAGRKAMDGLSEVPLYGRVDLVRANGGAGYWLIEFELIEPSLYFRIDAASATNFAEALATRHA